MKAKNSERRLVRWSPRIGLALIVVPLSIPLMAISLIFGLFYIDDMGSTPDDALLGKFYRATDSYTVLHQQRIAEPAGTFYLAVWFNRNQRACLGMIWIRESGGGFDFNSENGTKADCVSGRFSIDQYWRNSLWHPASWSAAYGYSGDAARVVIIWQDMSETDIKPVNGVYLAIRNAKSRVIKFVDFYSASGTRLYRLPDDAGADGS